MKNYPSKLSDSLFDYNYLRIINDIRFTPREIDIIACLLSGKSSKTIAQFLLIEEKTVETHKYNIMRKLECNSKESIIEFIERSDKFSDLKQHYLTLLNQTTFEKCLKKIFKLIEKEEQSCLLAYEKKDAGSFFLKKLKNDLELVGLKLHFEENKPQQLLSNFLSQAISKKHNLLIYLTPETFLKQSDQNKKQKEDFAEAINFKTQDKVKILFLAQNMGDNLKTSQITEVQNFIDIGELSYYFSFFKILQTLLPWVNLEKIITEFEQHYKETVVSSDPLFSPFFPSKNERKESDALSFKSLLTKRKNYFFIVGSLFIGGLILSFLMLDNGKKEILLSNQSTHILKNTQDSSQIENTPTTEELIVRSDFKIPAILLDRPEIIERIERKLENSEGINTVALIGVIGIGGAGKTVLARQFGKFCKFHIVWELNAERKESLINSFQGLAHALAKTTKKKQELQSALSIQNIEEKERQLLFLVKGWLKEQQNWLLIYDNVENISSISDYFPQDPQVWGAGKVIVTTRDSNIGNTEYITHANVIQIEELSDNEKLELFSRIFYNKSLNDLMLEQKECAIEFLKNIPPYPLDVTVAAYYLKITGTSFEKYLQNLTSINADFERVQSILLKEIGGYTKTRYNIITMSLEHLIYSNEDFKNLLLLISLLDSQNISRELLSEYKSDIVIGEFIYNLRKYSFITNESSSRSGAFFSIHRSTQAIILAYLMQNLHLDKNKKVLERISEILEQYVSSLLEKEDVIKLTLVSNHLQAFLSHKDILTEKIETYIKICIGFAGYFTDKNSIPALQDSLSKLINYPYQEMLKAHVMSILADGYRRYGDYDKAEKLLQESCIIYKKNGTPTANEAYAYASLGLLSQVTGDCQKAKEFLKKSISIYKNFPKNSIGMARALSFLGLTYAELGLYQEAIDYAEQGQQIYKKQSESHYRVSWIMLYIGDMYRKLGNYKKAIQFLEESSEFRNKYYDSTKTINALDGTRILCNLAIINGELGNYHQAISVLEENLEHYRKAFPKSSERIRTAAHLAEVYRKLGNYDKALILIEESLSVHNNNITNHSVDIRGAWLMAKLGSIYNDLNNHMEAWKLLGRSLNIYKNLYGDDNIKTAKILFRLGQVYKSLGQSKEAIKIFEKCLPQYKKNFGENHIKTAQLMNSLADAYLMDNKFEQTENLLNKALNIFKTSEHNNIYMSLEGIGDLYGKKAIEAKKNGDDKQFKGFIELTIDNFEQALSVFKANIARENSAHLIRLQLKLKNMINISANKN